LPRARLPPSDRPLAAAIETIVRVNESFSMIVPMKRDVAATIRLEFSAVRGGFPPAFAALLRRFFAQLEEAEEE
jgi:hypothetical protein